jgi:hypothetical protein
MEKRREALALRDATSAEFEADLDVAVGSNRGVLLYPVESKREVLQRERGVDHTVAVYAGLTSWSFDVIMINENSFH